MMAYGCSSNRNDMIVLLDLFLTLLCITGFGLSRYVPISERRSWYIPSHLEFIASFSMSIQ